MHYTPAVILVVTTHARNWMGWRRTSRIEYWYDADGALRRSTFVGF